VDALAVRGFESAFADASPRWIFNSGQSVVLLYRDHYLLSLLDMPRDIQMTTRQMQRGITRRIALMIIIAGVVLINELIYHHQIYLPSDQNAFSHNRDITSGMRKRPRNLSRLASLRARTFSGKN